MCVEMPSTYKRKDVKRGAERLTKEALKLAHEYYADNKLKKKDVRATKLVDFEGIAKHLNVNIMLYEPSKESGKDVGKLWRLLYGKIQYRDTLFQQLTWACLKGIVFISTR